jgi:glycosyltransferase involved in cell wall biosynthesis
MSVRLSADPISLAWVNLTGGGLSGGSKKYLSAVLPRLAADSRFARITVHSPSEAAAAGLPSLPSYTWPAREHLRGFPALRSQLRELKPDVVYVPTSRWVETNGVPLVVMLRNMEPLTLPWAEGKNGLYEGFKNISRRLASRRACRRASGVIAVSEFVADFLRREWRIDATKIRMIYHGLSHDIAPAARPRAVVSDAPFFFTAGSIRPFRGLEDVIRAAATLAPKFPAHRFVIAGAVEGRVESYRRQLVSLSRDAGVIDRIIWTGKLNTHEMSWCYRHCTAFIMSSRVEACPNTALEAMEHGAACVSTTNPPMPEFFGDAVCYYPAGDATRLATTLGEMVDDEAVRRRYQRAALDRSHAFSWDRTARETADFLLSIAASGRNH